jgi:D-alanine-D-alanine ligase-like ATP-grasp enzyme
VQVQQVTGIKFLGCDIVLDEQAGPLLLEINVRPGLEIQNVNLAPLKTRLDKVEGVDVNSVEKGVRV